MNLKANIEKHLLRRLRKRSSLLVGDGMKIKFGNPYMHIGEKISVIQRLIILHSYIYYELDDSAITDREYDKLCNRYLEIVLKVSRDTLSKTDYYDVMVDFDGSTGFDLYGKLTDKQQAIIKSIANDRRRFGSV